MIQVRSIRPGDRAAWQPLWDGYNAFYGREGATALPAEISDTSFARFLDPAEPVHALVAEDEQGRLLGLVHYLFHRSTTRIEPVCYLQDLFTAPEARGQGAGRALIAAVYAAAHEAGTRRVYWHTQHGNTTARALYDRLARHLGFIVYSHDVA
ncbi:GNAT family N-acetyltransferase [Roseateles asaccharophilus]|uniref:GNAT superfamily N-acetyltransferase n=1 Tax=Roseateles asaccharophilus TaxID=582607 RepID=A0ABU2A6G5_9BURK|nr:GNAT family N-acetyltransferase [Roseateles asaccharophilus]MDR7332203.1 GNAT superfamily N-acetyltransferase [Roseateles asaccharophilus]